MEGYPKTNLGLSQHFYFCEKSKNKEVCMTYKFKKKKDSHLSFIQRCSSVELTTI